MIFNGNLLTEKKNNQLKLWQKAFNKKQKQEIIFRLNNKIPSLNDAWLSGFTDAEGCFTVSVIKRSEINNQVQVRYIISQQGELNLLSMYTC